MSDEENQDITAKLPKGKIKDLTRMFTAAGLAAEGADALGNILDKIIDATGVKDVWTAFTDSLANAVAQQTAKSVQDLIEKLNDPANKATMDALSAAIGGVMTQATSLSGAIITLGGWIFSTQQSVEAFSLAIQGAQSPLLLAKKLFDEITEAMNKMVTSAEKFGAKATDFWDEFWRVFFESSGNQGTVF